jgi:predicted nucleotidyltransferase
MLKKEETGLQDSDVSDIIGVITRNDKINQVILFGSRAKGTYHTGSDIDIALSGNGLNTDDIIDLMNELEELYLPYKFDLLILERIKEIELLAHISRVGKVLYDKNKSCTQQREA